MVNMHQSPGGSSTSSSSKPYNMSDFFLGLSAWYETRELKRWIRQGEIPHLKQVVLKGDGQRLLGESSPNPKTRSFLRLLPSILARLEMCHDACIRGNVTDLQQLLESPPGGVPLELSLDSNGLGLLHKAVIYNHLDVVEFLLDTYPHTLDLLDKIITEKDPLTLTKDEEPFLALNQDFQTVFGLSFENGRDLNKFIVTDTVKEFP